MTSRIANIAGAFSYHMCFSWTDYYHVRLACMARHFSGFLCVRCEVMFIVVWSEFHWYLESWQLRSRYGGVPLVNLCIIEVAALILKWRCLLLIMSIENELHITAYFSHLYRLGHG